MLDGGLTAWRAESGPLEQGPSALEPTDFAATERPGFFVDQNEVLAIVEGRARGVSSAFFALRCSRELSKGIAAPATSR